MPTSPSTRLALTGPLGSEPPNGPDLAQTLIPELEAVAVRFDTGTQAARLAAPHINGRFWYETGAAYPFNNQLYYDDGTNWQPVSRRILWSDSFPTSPADGERAIITRGLLGDVGTWTTWEFCYDAALAALDGYGWKFIGGPPEIAESTTTYSFTPNGSTAIGGPNPVITVPFSGYYCIDGIADVYPSSFASYVGSQLLINGANYYQEAINNYAAGYKHPSRTTLPMLLSLGDHIMLGVFSAQASGTVYAARRRVQITPIRVSA